MSAALSEDQRLERRAEMRKARKRREIKRRQVVTCPDDLSWWLECNHKALGYATVPEALRELALIGLEKQFSVSGKDIRLVFKKYEAEKLLEEIAVLQGEDESDDEGA